MMTDARDKNLVDRINGRTGGAVVDAVAPVLFKWQDGQRVHAGWFAQDVKAGLDAVGIDCGAWGMEDISDTASRQWIRPDELVAFLWAAVQAARMDRVVDHMSEIAARCSSPDPAVAAASNQVMDADATRTGQTREQRIAYWLNAQATSLMATAEAVLARPA